MNELKNDITLKRVYRVFIFESLIITLIIGIFEIIFKHYNFFFLISFIIGSIISAFCFFLSAYVLNKAINSYGRTYSMLIGFNFLKLIIYGLCLYLVYFSPLHNGIYTCFLGFLGIRISILIEYSIIEKYKDKYRRIDKLNVSEEIISKLKNNNIFYTRELINLNHEDLGKYLDENEIKLLSKSIREYGLFLKGELEVIKEDENSVSDEL